MRKFRYGLAIFTICSVIMAFTAGNLNEFNSSLSMQTITDPKFQHCIIPILQHEGGLSDDKDDPGGITQWGISLRYLRSIGYDVDRNGDIDGEDIRDLNKLGAEEIYHKYWWEKYHYAEFSQLIVVEKVFDMAVNMGGSGAHRILQKAINHHRLIPIPEDGILASHTFSAANAIEGSILRQALRDFSRLRYLDILAAHPHMEVFRNGWLRRAEW